MSAKKRPTVKALNALDALEAQLGNWLFNLRQQERMTPNAELIRMLQGMRNIARRGLDFEGPGT